ncbi:hypothetical protein J6590_032593 [Homalodisca vitripennis]|nr:hypothetical protein J6590_032593 [Homalodisca vitripennis]
MVADSGVTARAFLHTRINTDILFTRVPILDRSPASPASPTSLASQQGCNFGLGALPSSEDVPYFGDEWQQYVILMHARSDLTMVIAFQ